jgi:hypothetical protein
LERPSLALLDLAEGHNFNHMLQTYPGDPVRNLVACAWGDMERSYPDERWEEWLSSPVSLGAGTK